MSFQIGSVSSTCKILSWGGRSVAINKINAVDVVCDKRAFPKFALLGVFFGLIFLGKDPFLGLLLLGICGFWLYWWSNHIYHNYCVRMKTSSSQPFYINFGDNAAMARQVCRAIVEEMSVL